IMTWLVLSSQGEAGPASVIAVDAARPAIMPATTAEVSELGAMEGTLLFTAVENAIPYPVDNEVVKSGAPTAADALALIPFQEILNRQVLQITGLTAPAYDLFIDDQQVGRYSPEQLAAGIDL